MNAYKYMPKLMLMLMLLVYVIKTAYRVVTVKSNFLSFAGETAGTVTMASCKENGEETSSAVSSSDVVVVATSENDEPEHYEQLDNVHSDFLQHFENEIRISHPDSVSLTKGGSSVGGATVPDSSGIRSSSQLQHITDNDSPGMFQTDDAADVLSTPDPYVVSDFVGAGTDMYIISPPLSSRIEG